MERLRLAHRAILLRCQQHTNLQCRTWCHQTGEADKTRSAQSNQSWRPVPRLSRKPHGQPPTQQIYAVVESQQCCKRLPVPPECSHLKWTGKPKTNYFNLVLLIKTIRYTIIKNWNITDWTMTELDTTVEPICVRRPIATTLAKRSFQVPARVVHRWSIPSIAPSTYLWENRQMFLKMSLPSPTCLVAHLLAWAYWLKCSTVFWTFP